LPVMENGRLVGMITTSDVCSFSRCHGAQRRPADGSILSWEKGEGRRSLKDRRPGGRRGHRVGTYRGKWGDSPGATYVSFR
jgi:hypothetical protein